MKNLIFIFFLMIFGLSSCKQDRFSHSDKDYLYYWIYDINGDSVLRQFHKPRTVEYQVCGGRHRTSRRNRTHKIYVYKTDNSREFVSVSVYSTPNQNRCEIVDRAKDAERHGKILIGIFEESFYPHYKLEFIKYKN